MSVKKVKIHVEVAHNIVHGCNYMNYNVRERI